MDAVKNEVIQGLRARQCNVSEAHLEYLKREQSLYDAPEKRAFLEAVKKCINYARGNNLTLGPGARKLSCQHYALWTGIQRY